MGKKLRILLISLFVACLCIGAIVWQMWSSSVPDPIYNGKPLSYWLTGCLIGYLPYPTTSTNPVPVPSFEDAQEAVQHLGTNALPMLLQILREPDHPLKERLLSIAAKQNLVRIRQPTPAAVQKIRASQALSALGTNIIPAIPELMEIYDRHTGVLSDQIVPGILSVVGPPAEIAIPMLMRGTSHTNAFVRQNSVLALGNIQAQPHLVVPVLVKCLSDPVLDVQVNAAYSLGQFGSSARQAVPALLQLLQSLPPQSPSTAPGGILMALPAGWAVGEGPASLSPNTGFRLMVTDAINKIYPDASTKAGIK